MSDDEDENETPTVSLGDGATVEGAPLARISSRLTWGMARSTVLDRVGDTAIRTPEGPRELASILEEVDLSYFESRHEFESRVRDVVGVGPVPTEDSGSESTEE